jgi:hypothetical protein
LAVELSGGIVRIAVFVFGRSFSLALLEGVVEIGLGESVEGKKGEAERGYGRVKVLDSQDWKLLFGGIGRAGGGKRPRQDERG